MKRLALSVAAASSLAFTPVFGAELGDGEMDKVVGGTYKSGAEFVKQTALIGNNANKSPGAVQQTGVANFNKSFNDNDVLSHNKVASGNTIKAGNGNDVNVLSHNKRNATAVSVGVLGKGIASAKTY
jgi:hypothetical protein